MHSANRLPEMRQAQGWFAFAVDRLLLNCVGHTGRLVLRSTGQANVYLDFRISWL
jgi:hypothetical protein